MLDLKQDKLEDIGKELEKGVSGGASGGSNMSHWIRDNILKFQ